MRSSASTDWPLAIELAMVFVVISLVRWRWFKARMRRAQRPPAPPREPPRDSAHE